MRKRYISLTKIMAVVLSLAVLIVSVPFATANATDTDFSTEYIAFEGGWNPQQYPQSGELYKDRIAVSKTVTPAEKENYFDVNLEIVAKPRVIDRSMDVVVVMDISNTMNYTHSGLSADDAGYNIRDTRLSHAKIAVSDFIDLYSQDTLLSTDRNFALVTFNSYASTLIPLTKVGAGESAEELKAKVLEISASEDNRERFTNTEGGLQLAYNILSKSDSDFKYVIFITDGYPSTYIEGENTNDTFLNGFDTCMSGSYDAAQIGKDGYFADAVTGKLCSHGVSYSDKAAEKAAQIAAKIKDSGINVFSIGIDVDEQSISDMLNTAEITAYTTIDREKEDVVAGISTEQYTSWIANSISGGAMIEAAEINEIINRFTPVDNLESLKTAFDNILVDMEKLPSETMEEAYTLDYLSDYVEFINFYDLKGEAVNQVINTRNGSDVATFDPETNAIKWWLTTTQKYHIDEIGNYVLSVSYRIRLRNELQGFEYGKAFDTANSTTFFFKTMDFVTGEPLYGDNSIVYPVPQVKGYSADFAFANLDETTGEPLQGAEFMLAHYGESCHICNGDAAIAVLTATADEQGQVCFEDLASGHEYLLMQTKAPLDLAKCGYHSLRIADSKVYFDGKEVTLDKPAVVTNGIYEPASVSLIALKKLAGRELKDGEFTFALEGENGDMFHERISSDASGVAKFYEILFDKPGTYRFTVSELKGNDTTVIYDTRVYSLEFVVTLIEGTGFELDTKVDGKTLEKDEALPVFEFESELRKPVSVSLEGEKLYDGVAPSDNVFSFVLKDSNGKLIDSKSTENGRFVFDEISFDKTGIYKYTITESHQCGEEDTELNVFFDHSVYEAVIIVTAPDGSDSFEAEVKYYLKGEAVDKIQFANYTREKAEITINASVTLDSEPAAEGEFSYELRTISGELIEKVQNDAMGNIAFSALEFDREGYFVFFINQVKGSNTAVTYCDTVYSVFVVSEVHHNLSSYYLDVMVSEVQGDNLDKHIHIYGSELALPASYGAVFENVSAIIETEPSEPAESETAPTFTEPEVTEPAEETTAEVQTTASDPAETTAKPAEPAETSAQETSSAPQITDATSVTDNPLSGPDTVPTGADAGFAVSVSVMLFALAAIAICGIRRAKKR